MMNFILATCNEGRAIIEKNTMFMYTRTMFEVLVVTEHVSGMQIGVWFTKED